MEGIIQRKDKPSNTEILGLLLDQDKLQFITNLHGKNIEGLCKLSYFTKRLKDLNRNPVEIHNEVMQDYLCLKCSILSNKDNRAQQIVDAIKHQIDKDQNTQLQSLADQIKS
jgi:hypothetical protein